MSKTVNEIAKLTINQLAKSNTLLTPQNYEQTYEELAAKLGVSSGRAERISAYIDRLASSAKEDALRARPSTEAELISFLIAKINAQKGATQQDASILLLRALFKILSKSLNPKASRLAQKSEQELKNLDAIAQIKNAWIAELGEISEQMDEYLMQANKFGLTGDAQSDFATLKASAASSELDALCEKLAPAMAYSLTPSIASEQNTQISAQKEEIAANPKRLSEPNWAQIICELVKKRIELDRAEISSSHHVLDELLNEVSSKIETILQMATSSEEKISQIKKEIEEIKSSSPAIDALKKRLISIVNSLEGEISSLRSHTLKDISELSNLQARTNSLQQEIEKLREENQQDFLTQLANKRALEYQLAAAEEGFELYNINYCVVFFDIDHFKRINDGLGHTAGDVVLAAIASIIARNCRKLDTAGRYGGEEFMLILPHTDLAAAAKLAEHIREQVASHKFIYKNKSIRVSISGGVAERACAQGKDQLVESADKLLYAAKNAGRNQIKS